MSREDGASNNTAIRCNINSIPPEILIQIFHSVDDLHTLAQCFFVCTQWKAILEQNDEKIFKRFDEFGEDCGISLGGQYFRRSYSPYVVRRTLNTMDVIVSLTNGKTYSNKFHGSFDPVIFVEKNGSVVKHGSMDANFKALRGKLKPEITKVDPQVGLFLLAETPWGAIKSDRLSGDMMVVTVDNDGNWIEEVELQHPTNQTKYLVSQNLLLCTQTAWYFSFLKFGPDGSDCEFHERHCVVDAGQGYTIDDFMLLNPVLTDTHILTFDTMSKALYACDYQQLEREGDLKFRPVCTFTTSGIMSDISWMRLTVGAVKDKFIVLHGIKTGSFLKKEECYLAVINLMTGKVYLHVAKNVLAGWLLNYNGSEAFTITTTFTKKSEKLIYK